MRTVLALLIIASGLLLLAACGQTVKPSTQKQQVAAIAHSEATLNHLWSDLTGILASQPPLSQAKLAAFELDVRSIVAECDSWRLTQAASPGIAPAVSYWQAGLKLWARAAGEYRDVVKRRGEDPGGRADSDQQNGALLIDLAVQVIDNLPVAPAYTLPSAF